VGNHIIILVPHLILNSGDPNILTHLKSNFNNKFEIKTLSHFDSLFDIQVLKMEEGISLPHSKYA